MLFEYQNVKNRIKYEQERGRTEDMIEDGYSTVLRVYFERNYSTFASFASSAGGGSRNFADYAWKIILIIYYYYHGKIRQNRIIWKNARV